MTKIKLCGLSRVCDIDAANALGCDYIGFVFAPKSPRYVTEETAAALKSRLDPAIQAVGVFVNETPENVASLMERGIIDLAQLHGQEDGEYLSRLRSLTAKPVIQAFRVLGAETLTRAEASGADFILLDAGAGTGTVFDWSILNKIRRPYFLAGGLTPENAREAVETLRPYAVDVSSGIETERKKDRAKMEAFVAAVRRGDGAA